jgi:chromosome partitioning protein
MTKVLAVFNTKGGSGKSTISMHVGVAASEKLNTVILDADPNKSSVNWGKTRETSVPVVKEISSTRLLAEIADLRKAGVDLVILDCPPSINADTVQLVSAADFVVVPVQPTILDVTGCYNATKMIAAQKKPFVYIVSRCPTPSPDTRDAIRALEKSGEVCPVVISDRIAFSRALAYGLAVTEYEKTGKAFEEAMQSCKWILEKIGVANGAQK